MSVIPRYRLRRCLRRLSGAAGGLLWLGAAAGAFGQEAAPEGTPAPQAGLGESRTRVEELPAHDWGQDYQVKVGGGDPLTRTRFRIFVGDLREDFRRLLYKLRPTAPRERERWTVPIRVQLWGTFQDIHRGRDVLIAVEQRMDGRFVVAVEVRLHDRFDEEKFRRELVRALLIEQIVAPYDGNPTGLGVEAVEPPAWLVEGFDRLVVHRRGGSPSAYYRGFLEKGQLLRPAETIGVEDAAALDPVRREIFRASASALVEALLDQPEGDESLRGLLGDLGSGADRATEALLRQHFPGFRETEQGLEKWWALEMASLAQRHSFEFLDREETERLLDEALVLRLEGPNAAAPAREKRSLLDRLRSKPPSPNAAPEPFEGRLEEFEAYLRHPGAKEEISAVHDRLQALKRVAFPLYRPVFAGYERAIVRLSKGDTKGLAEDFASIAEMRTKIRETLVRTEDHLNHFEATRAPSRSESFDGYFRLRRDLEHRPPPPRSDPISRHLDGLEREFR